MFISSTGKCTYNAVHCSVDKIRTNLWTLLYREVSLLRLSSPKVTKVPFFIVKKTMGHKFYTYTYKFGNSQIWQIFTLCHFISKNSFYIQRITQQMHINLKKKYYATTDTIYAKQQTFLVSFPCLKLRLCGI